MFVSRVSATRLSSQRLDADFYRPEYIANEARLLTQTVGRLGEVGHFFAGPFGSLLPSTLYLDEGIPLFRVGNVGQFEVLTDNFAHLAPHVHNDLKASEVRPGDLLVVKASVGEKICKVPDWISKANITQHIIGIRPNGTFDTDYVSAFLFSNFGVLQLQRYSLGSIIQYLGITDAKRTFILKVGSTAQKYIGDKVRQAERLRAWAKVLNISVAEHFSGLVKSPLSPRVSWIAKKEDLDPYRINPKQYDPVVLDLIQRAKVGCTRLEPLSALVGARKIAGGATPKGAQYFDRGILFARVQNVKPLRLDLSDAVYIDQSADEELARSRCAADDIIFTITGYPGTASLVTEEDLPVNINQHSVRFNIRDGIEPGYVCAALNSKFLKYQVDRLAIGGTRDALDYPSVGRLLIPRYEPEVEKYIGEQARHVNSAVKLSQRLNNAAKLLIEALIQCQLTEEELTAAEQALQAGSDQLDRSILNRLHTDGIDGQEPMLFSDIDELYHLLKRAEEV